jgi:Domain of unknown function (DUF5664)
MIEQKVITKDERYYIDNWLVPETPGGLDTLRKAVLEDLYNGHAYNSLDGIVYPATAACQRFLIPAASLTQAGRTYFVAAPEFAQREPEFAQNEPAPVASEPETAAFELTKFEGGATRSAKQERRELVPKTAIDALSRRLALGAEKHGVNNWRLGGEEFRLATINHLLDHIFEYLEHGGTENTDAIICNAAFLCDYQDRMPWHGFVKKEGTE